LRTSTAVLPDADWSRRGPADSTVFGLNDWKPVFHPTRSATCAGTRWSNSARQSVNGVVNLTMTVRPLSVERIEAMSR
jgi:hypothetical protein